MQEPILDDEPTETPKALAVQTQLNVVTQAIEVALGVRELTTEFYNRRAELIAAGQEFKTPPTNDEEQEEILKRQRRLAGFRIEGTKQADVLKAALNEPRTIIIELVKSGLAPVTKEEDRLKGLVNHRQQLLLRERQEKEAAAERERQRLASEAAAAQRAQEEAERKRRAAELAAQQAEELKGKAKAKAEAEAERLRIEAAAAEDAALEKAIELETTPAPTAEPVSDLPMAREVYDFTINGRTDAEKKASLIELARQHPELFSATIREDKPRGYTLALKILDVNDRLNGKSAPFDAPPAGITITRRMTNLR